MITQITPTFVGGDLDETTGLSVITFCDLLVDRRVSVALVYFGLQSLSQACERAYQAPPSHPDFLRPPTRKVHT